MEPVPEDVEPAAATPANAVEVDDIWGVVLEMAPANGTVVVAIDGAAIGAMARGALNLFVAVVESFVCAVVLSLEANGEVMPICSV